MLCAKVKHCVQKESGLAGHESVTGSPVKIKSYLPLGCANVSCSCETIADLTLLPRKLQRDWIFPVSADLS